MRDVLVQCCKARVSWPSLASLKPQAWRSMCGWIGKGILAPSPTRWMRRWNPMGPIGPPRSETMLACIVHQSLDLALGEIAPFDCQVFDGWSAFSGSRFHRNKAPILEAYWLSDTLFL